MGRARAASWDGTSRARGATSTPSTPRRASLSPIRGDKNCTVRRLARARGATSTPSTPRRASLSPIHVDENCTGWHLTRAGGDLNCVNTSSGLAVSNSRRWRAGRPRLRQPLVGPRCLQLAVMKTARRAALLFAYSCFAHLCLHILTVCVSFSDCILAVG